MIRKELGNIHMDFDMVPGHKRMSESLLVFK